MTNSKSKSAVEQMAADMISRRKFLDEVNAQLNQVHISAGALPASVSTVGAATNAIPTIDDLISRLETLRAKIEE